MISYRSYFHKRCVCHAKFSSANTILTESPGKDSWAQEKNVQNFIKVHFRLLTANPKAEALYLITETAKKKENIIQNILRPRGYYPSFVSTLICFMCPFKHQWKSSKRIKLKINCSCKIWELQKKKKSRVKWRFQTSPTAASPHSVLWDQRTSFRMKMLKQLSIKWLLRLWKFSNRE